jgi:Spy/CpxP family protein refolding chaperone
MNLKHVLIAAGIGLAGLLGTTAATANAAPGACTSSPQTCSIVSKASGSGVNLTHHQQKQLDKLIKKSQAQQSTRPVK